MWIQGLKGLNKLYLHIKKYQFFSFSCYCIVKCHLLALGVYIFLRSFRRADSPLSPNSDQRQFSPNNIHTMSRD